MSYKSIMTLTKTINYTIDSEQLFKVIARNNGLTLTEIVKAVNPDFDFHNTPKTAYRHAIDVLVNSGRVRYTLKGKSKKRDLYFLDCEYRETSKRVLFQNFIQDLKYALNNPE